MDEKLDMNSQEFANALGKMVTKVASAAAKESTAKFGSLCIEMLYGIAIEILKRCKDDTPRRMFKVLAEGEGIELPP